MRQTALFLTITLLFTGLLPVQSAGAQDAAVQQLTAVPGAASTLASLVNSYRAQNGLAPLIVDSGFSANTQSFADSLMAAAPPVANGCPNASINHASGAAIAASAPAGTVAYGENLAYYCHPNFSTHPQEMFNGLRNSAAHNTAMLNPRWTHMGVAASRWGHSTMLVNRFAEVPGTNTTQGTSGSSADRSGGGQAAASPTAVSENTLRGPSVASPTAVPTAAPAAPQPTPVPQQAVVQPTPTPVASAPSTATTQDSTTTSSSNLGSASTADAPAADTSSASSTGASPTPTVAEAAPAATTAPAATEAISDDPEPATASAASGDAQLAFTGQSTWILLGFGSGLVLLGLALTTAGRRRSTGR